VDDKDKGKAVDAQVSTTGEDGRHINIMQEAEYYAKHPEELENLKGNATTNISIKISIPVLVGVVLCCIALGFLLLYKGG
jgi:hypothetical protein